MREFPSKQAFTECVGSKFLIQLTSTNPMEVDLIKVSGTPASSNGRLDSLGDRPFSLIFRGPMSPILFQKIHTVSHEKLGEHLIFLVPIGPDGIGICYEAVFN
jgi:hypothetical protein